MCENALKIMISMSKDCQHKITYKTSLTLANFILHKCWKTVQNTFYVKIAIYSSSTVSTVIKQLTLKKKHKMADRAAKIHKLNYMIFFKSNVTCQYE